MREKWVLKKARDLKQGDTFNTGVMVHSTRTIRELMPTGFVHRTYVDMVGGDHWIISADREVEVLEPATPHVPYFRYTLTELLAFNAFTMAATTILILWMQHQQWLAL